MKLGARIVREAYRRERIPMRVLWWLAAEGMRDWYRVLARELTPHVGGDARPLLARLGTRMFERRWAVLRERYPHLREGDLPLVMSRLYRIDRAPKAAWIVGGLGAPRGGALRAMLPIRPRARWEEVTTHLGELLVVLTEDLPAHLPHARKILGDICFRMGERFAAHTKEVFDLDASDPPLAAIEVLRMSEYVFRVNPEHWHASDGTSGYLEGTACPWFDRPGWNGAHCGIFGQFQAGISSAFGLRYHLAKTIPKHGGATCRVDLKPIQLRRPASMGSNNVEK